MTLRSSHVGHTGLVDGPVLAAFAAHPVLVYGAPVSLEPQPWPRRQADARQAVEVLRKRFLDPLVEARRATGRELPGPLPTSDEEQSFAGVPRDAARERHDDR